MRMMNEITLSQKQNLTQAQMMVLNLLTMTNAEMHSYIQNEYDTNPMLDHLNKETVLHRDAFSKDTKTKASLVDNQSGELVGDRLAQIADEEENMITCNVLMQLDESKFSKKQWNVLTFMAELLDTKGFMNTPLSDIAAMLSCDHSLVKSSYEVLAALKPFGIFSVDVRDFMLKQLNNMDVPDTRILRLLEEFSEELIQGDFVKILKEMKISREELSTYMKVLGSLKTQPLSLSERETYAYIVPDILIRKSDGSFEVSLNDGWMGEYQHSTYYMQLMETTEDLQLKAYLKEKYQRSKFLFDCIERRRETILSIMGVILELQYGYFSKNQSLTPMTLQSVAERVNLHSSTVSRAMRGKFIEYPFGTVAAKKLFTQSVGISTGQEKSKSDIEKVILKIVEKESKDAPLSDEEISMKLRDVGIRISRRTVSKYRKMLGILDSYNRRYLEPDG